MGPGAGKGPVANLGQKTISSPVESYDLADLVVLELFVLGKDAV